MSAILGQLSGKGFMLLFPHFYIWWLRNRAGCFQLFVMLVKISNESAVCDFEIFLFLKPTTQFGDRPMSLVSESRLFDGSIFRMGKLSLPAGVGANHYKDLTSRISPFPELIFEERSEHKIMPVRLLF